MVWNRVLRAVDPVASLPLEVSQAGVQLVDVGARGALDERWSRWSAVLEVVGFEPDAEECARLEAEANRRALRRRYLPFAVGTQPELVLQLCREPGCSSVYPPNTALLRRFDPSLGAKLEVIGQRHVKAIGLDEAASRHGLRPDVLKADVQGSELDVLQSGARLLTQTKLIEVEVEFCAQYQGQPLFADVDAFLRSRGFELLGIRRTSWRRAAGTRAHPTLAGGQLIHGDALYLNAELWESSRAPSLLELCRWAVPLSAYRQHDLVAAALLEHPLAKELEEPTRQRLLGALAPSARLGLARVGVALSTLRHVRRRLLRQWAWWTGRTQGFDWHDGDFF